MRRYTRLSNVLSRKMENHAAAMAAGVTDRRWSVEDLAALQETNEQRRAERVA
jgi:hypothetical protein